MEPKGGAPAGRTVLGTKKWPTWAQDRFPNRAKIDFKIDAKIELKTMPFKIDFWSDFGIDFSSILARYGNPSCGHVGHFFLTKTVLPAGAPPFVSMLAPC